MRGVAHLRASHTRTSCTRFCNELEINYEYYLDTPIVLQAKSPSMYTKFVKRRYLRSNLQVVLIYFVDVPPAIYYYDHHCVY